MTGATSSTLNGKFWSETTLFEFEIQLLTIYVVGEFVGRTGNLPRTIISEIGRRFKQQIAFKSSAVTAMLLTHH